MDVAQTKEIDQIHSKSEKDHSEVLTKKEETVKKSDKDDKFSESKQPSAQTTSSVKQTASPLGKADESILDSSGSRSSDSKLVTPAKKKKKKKSKSNSPESKPSQSETTTEELKGKSVRKKKKKSSQSDDSQKKPNGQEASVPKFSKKLDKNNLGISDGKSKQSGKTLPKSVKLQSNLADKFKNNDFRRSALINQFQQFVHETCVNAGFEYTGRQYFRANANFFESVKLTSLYDKHLKECIPKACTLERDRLRQKLLLLRALNPSVDFLCGIISGVPGSGKSTIVRKLLKGEFPAVCALANPALATDYSGIEGVYRLDDLLLSAVPITSDLLIIDEYTLAESAEILLLQRRLRASMVILVGDVAQGKATTASSIEYLTLPVIYRSETSYRLGQETAKLCGKQGNRMVSKGGRDTVVITDYDGETDSTEKNIAFTKETVKDLKECGYDCALVSDMQGKEFDTVTLFIRNEDRKVLEDKHLRLVALSRHKSKLIIRADAEIRQAFLTGDIDSSSKASNSHRYSSKPNEDRGWFKAK